MKITSLVLLLALALNCRANGQGVPAENPPGGGALPTINASAAITTNGTFQTLLAANTNRHYLEIVNNNTNNACYIIFGTLVNGTVITAGNAVTGKAMLLAPGGGYYSWVPPAVPSDEIEVTCTGTGSLNIYAAYR